MKKLLLLTAILPLLLFSSCSHKDDIVDNYNNTPPAAPTGLIAANGDGTVYLSWNKNRESYVAGYNIYVSNTYKGKYQRIGNTVDTYFEDVAAANGATYYYAVTAYDNNGNESDLSLEDAHMTPRPEGYNKIINDYNKYPATAGFAFASATVVAYDDNYADVFFDVDTNTGVPYLDVYDKTQIYDAGTTSSIADIAYPPTNGWVNTYLRAYAGHTYIIITQEGNYAKLRINSMNTQSITFDWSYQTVAGNTDLSITRGKHNRTVIRSNTANQK